MEDAKRKALQWIEDSLVFGPTFKQALKSFVSLLQGIIKKRVKLNIKKCNFLQQELEWCD